MPGGRKGKYEEWLTEDGLLRIQGWAREGLSDEQIARDKMGIAQSTFYEWANRFEEFSEALKKGKAPVDIEVENALLKSALGYTVTVKEPVKVKKRTEKKGVGTIEEEHVEIHEREIYIKPEPAAQFFWLKNRKPDKWRDKPVADTIADDPLFQMLEKWSDAAKAAKAEPTSGDGE